MSKDFFNSFVEDLDDQFTSIAVQGLSAAESTGFIDTGSYALNAALSGSIYGGLYNNKVLVLAGDPTTGKTFFALGIVAAFLAKDPKARVFYFDTEAAVTNEMLTARGIDLTRVAKSEPTTLQRFNQVALKLLDAYEKLAPEDRFPMLIVFDSLSMLPSEKELGDMREGKDTKDMTKSQLIKAIFRQLRLKLAKLQVPMVVTNHTYAVIGAYVPTKEMAGGNGAKYASDTIAMLSKSKIRDDDKQVIGNIVTVKMAKSRLTKEETKVETRIRFDGGLDRYYGLLDYAVAAGIVTKLGNKYKFPNGASGFEKAVLSNPQKFYDKDVLDKVNEYLMKEFLYSNGVEPEDEDEADE